MRQDRAAEQESSGRLRAGALLLAVGAAALSAAQGWGADVIWVAYLPSFLVMAAYWGRQRQMSAAPTEAALWVRMVIPVIAVAGGIAWGLAEDALFLALVLLAAVAVWAAFPRTLD